MATVSLCMIVRNEESILEKCLESIAWIADEIIITDTGSKDNTVNIAQKYTKNILHFNWIDDFSAARNYTEKNAVSDYILRWDADWVLDQNCKKLLQQLKKNSFNSKDIVYFNWVLDFNQQSKKIYRQEPYFFLYKNHQFHWESPIHNDLVSNNHKQIPTSLVEQKINVFHYKDPQKKSHRFLQTDKILRQALQKTDKQNKQYFRLLEFHGQNLIFLDKIPEAIIAFEKALTNPELDDDKKSFLIEQLVGCYLKAKQIQNAQKIIDNNKSNKQRYWITRGDIYSFINHEIAIESYKKAIKIGPNSIDLNYERMIIHPNHMLAKLLWLTTQQEKSLIHLNYCIQNSHNQATVLECKELLNLLYD